MRGRNNNGGGGGNNNNNNRKGPNPLTRNYESNGPDVKIRGSAQQIAEKYATLARDAQSSGDRVMAENYLQHAEHYNRIIAAAQAQMPIQNVQNNRDDFDDDGDEERDDFENSGNVGGNGNNADAPALQANNGSGPQPVIEGTPAEVALNAEGRENGGNREGNGRQRERRPNGGHGQNGQQRGDYQPRGEHNGERARRAEAPVTPDSPPSGAPETAESAAAPLAQSENLSPADLAARAELNEAAADEAAAPRRPRRPRRPRVSADNAGETPAEASAGEPAVSES